MPNVLLTLLMLSALSVKAQEKFHYSVYGKIKGAPNGTVMYLLAIPPEIVDSCIVEDESFSFKGELFQPAEAIVFPGPFSRMQDERSRVQCWLDEQLVNINGILGDFGNATIHAGRAQKNYLDYVKGLPAGSDSLQLSYLVAYAKKHPDNYKAVQELFFRRQAIPLSTLREIYSGYSTQIRQSIFGESINKYISVVQRLKPGEAAPEFILPDMDNHPTKLSDFRGKYVLLNFWASNCAPCRVKNPLLNDIYRNYRNKNFVILGVGLDHYDNFAAAILKDEVKWPNTYDASFVNSKIIGTYNIYSIPYMLLLDPNGKIVLIQPNFERTPHGFIIKDSKGHFYGTMEDVLKGNNDRTVIRIKDAASQNHTMSTFAVENKHPNNF